jgi:hypothetical protein
MTWPLLQQFSTPLNVAVAPAQLVNGTVYLCGWYVGTGASKTLSFATFTVGTAGTGTSSGSYIGLYNSSQELISGSVSADIGSDLGSGPANLQFGAPQTLTGGSVYWVAVLVNLSGTVPTLYAVDHPVSDNNGFPGGNYHWCVYSTGGQTSLPSSVSGQVTETGALPFLCNGGDVM